MKLGLVCTNENRETVLEKIHSIGIEVYKKADLYVVEEGLHEGFLPCIVFRMDQLEELVDLLQSFTGSASSSKVVGMYNEEFYVVDHEQVLYFEATDSTVVCHTASEEYRVKEKLYQLEDRLPSDRYIKVNRSFIVNIDRVVKIIPWFNRRLLLKFDQSKKEVEVSKNYVGHFKEFLGMR
ncbi:LytTR family DNA-binding domain-containing protein [Bacillus coahuilensis]|uniref:LytTR family DNA-binding domain-containing protein n=1 Tax=Bacillus coahuilensis TaxID=408580 RepID=UPI000751711B|nr:LytTR family DNA-binding domain-containing protein [Bacillus coahuilensis]